MVRPSRTISETNRTASMLITSNQESRASARHHVPTHHNRPGLMGRRKKLSVPRPASRKIDKRTLNGPAASCRRDFLTRSPR